MYKPVGADGMVEKPSTDPVLDFCHCVSKLFCDSLALQSIDGIRLGGGRHDDERHHGDFRLRFHQTIVQA